MFRQSRNSWLIILMLALLLIASSSLVRAEMEPSRQETYYRGRVLFVNDQSPEADGLIKQEARVVVTSGPHQGETFDLKNNYQPGHSYFNIYLEEGMEVILVAEESDDRLEAVHLQDVARDRSLVYLVAIFVLLLILVGGLQGIKTILTLIFTGLIIIQVMLPLLLAGHNPILVASGSALIIIIPTLLVIGGWNVKSLAAIIGTGSGVAVAGLLALWVGELANLTGFSSKEAQILIQMEESLDIRGLLFAGIIIGSLGAVTDVSMSVAASIAEVKANNSRLSISELMSAGLNVGRDIMGTMANTLLLAYVGSTIPMLLLLLGVEMQWIRIINMDLIATELVRGITGSIGLILCIPITALVAGILLGRTD